MSDTKFSQLSAISALDDDDIMVVVEDGTPKKVTIAELRDALGGGGGTFDVNDIFDDPDTEFEFESSSLTGLTALSNTPDAEAAHTVIPGRYFLRDTDAGGIVGRYASAPSAPFTAICLLSAVGKQTEPPSTDLLIGETLTVNGTGDGSSAGINDGNDGSYWKSGQTAANASWVKNDFGADQNVTHFRVYDGVSSAGESHPFLVQGSDDNSAWTTYKTVGDGGSLRDTGVVALDTAAIHRYWRIISQGDSGWWGVFTWSLYSLDRTRAGMFIGEATPGDLLFLHFGSDERVIFTEAWTDPDTSGGDLDRGTDVYLEQPLWFAIRVNAADDVDTLWSKDGMIWVPSVEAHDPGFTIGSVGLGLKHDPDEEPTSGAWDFLRIWESALTLPGIP